MKITQSSLPGSGVHIKWPGGSQHRGLTGTHQPHAACNNAIYLPDYVLHVARGLLCPIYHSSVILWICNQAIFTFVKNIYCKYNKKIHKLAHRMDYILHFISRNPVN